MRILVTGAAGFIGSHAVDCLRAAGHEVQGLDSLTPAVHTGRPDYLPELQRELIAVISKYVSIKAEDIKVHLEKHDDLEVLQVKIELQADCLSGVWVNREEKKRPGFLEAGDIDAALTTASAVSASTPSPIDRGGRSGLAPMVPDS